MEYLTAEILFPLLAESIVKLKEEYNEELASYKRFQDNGKKEKLRRKKEYIMDLKRFFDGMFPLMEDFKELADMVSTQDETKFRELYDKYKALNYFRNPTEDPEVA